jgi:hypothetical protein
MSIDSKVTGNDCLGGQEHVAVNARYCVQEFVERKANEARILLTKVSAERCTCHVLGLD